MEIYNEKPIVEINWDRFNDGHFETFPPTIFYESGSDSDENCPDEIELIALVKSNGRVVGITPEGDTVNDVHELQDWDPELVFEYLEDNGYAGFKYYSDTNELRNQVMKPIGDSSGLLSGDYEKIPWSKVRSYMIEELIEQWRYMTPNASWDVIRLYAELELHWDDNHIPFHLKRNGSSCWIHNDNNIVIANQDADNPSRDYILLKDENGTLAGFTWPDMTDDKFNSHMKSWSELGVKSALRDTRDDDPAPKCEDEDDEGPDAEDEERDVTKVKKLFDYLNDKSPNVFRLCKSGDWTVIKNSKGNIIANNDKVFFHEEEVPYSELNMVDVWEALDFLKGETPREVKSLSKWFVCYEVTRYYDCCSPSKDTYDGEFEFRPETESLMDLKKRLADYQNAQDKGMKQKNPLTEKCITIINLTKLD